MRELFSINQREMCIVLKIQQLSRNYYSTENYKNKSVLFRGKDNNLERTPNQDSLETRKSTLKKIGIGAIAFAAIAGLSFAASKGKKSKVSGINRVTRETEDSAAKLREKLEQSRMEQEVKLFFENEERELAQKQREIECSNLRNESWLDSQKRAKEKEYSDFWNKALEEKEKYNPVSFDVKLEEAPLGNDIDLDWHFGKFTQSKHTRMVLEECKDLTFDSPNLKLIKDKYDKDNIYDLGLRYAIVANNTARAKGNSAIIREIPEMFRGIDEKELVESFDILPSLLDCKKINTFSIGGKEFQAELIGSGCLSDVYKITDSANNQICYKFGRDPYLMNSGQGFYNEFAILNEANNAGVVDVPKLYMGNPVGSLAQNPNWSGHTSRGAWEIIEFVQPNTTVPSDGLSLYKWLNTKGLFHGDAHSGNSVGGKVVDLGGICDVARTVNSIQDSANCISWLFRAYHNGKTSQEIIDIMDKYSK